MSRQFDILEYFVLQSNINLLCVTLKGFRIHARKLFGQRFKIIDLGTGIMYYVHIILMIMKICDIYNCVIMF